MTKAPDRTGSPSRLIRRLIDARSGIPGGRSAYDAHLRKHEEDAALAEELERLWDDIGRVPAPPLRLTPAPAKLSLVSRAAAPLKWAAPAALAASVAALFYLSPFTSRPDQPTPRSERMLAAADTRSLTLSDGSTVTLAPHSALTVRMTPGRRDLTLESGEAFFTVAHDKARPFVVTTARGQTTAVGTAFDVRVNGAGAIVTVAEGTVRVTTDGDDKTRYVTHGQQIAYRANGTDGATLGDLTAVDGQAAIAWTTGFLRFEGVALSTVIERVNAYSARKLVLRDAALAQLPIYASFKVGEIDGLRAVVAIQAGLDKAALDRKLQVESIG